MIVSSNISLIKNFIDLEFRDYNEFKKNEKSELVKEKDYNMYYKEFERLGKIYEKMAHNFKNTGDLQTSLNLFKLASLLYNESGIIRQKCQEVFYNADSNIKKFNNHILAYKNCYDRYLRCHNNYEKIKNNLLIK